jgi:hypothetical protein
MQSGQTHLKSRESKTLNTRWDPPATLGAALRAGHPAGVQYLLYFDAFALLLQ